MAFWREQIFFFPPLFFFFLIPSIERSFCFCLRFWFSLANGRRSCGT